MKILKLIYFLIAFVVGGALLSFELFIVKLIEPYFGYSFPVWSATIGTTMLGMICGYAGAQKVIDKYEGKLENALKWLLFLTTGVILILPFFARFILSLFLDLNLNPGIILSTILIDIPFFSILCLFSPIIIELVSRKYEETGKVSGQIYAISTFGGVVFLLISGIFILPNFGLQAAMVGFGILMLLVSLLVFVVMKKYPATEGYKNEINEE